MFDNFRILSNGLFSVDRMISLAYGKNQAKKKTFSLLVIPLTSCRTFPLTVLIFVYTVKSEYIID